MSSQEKPNLPDGKEGKRPGPEPERLKIEGDWEDALQKMLRKPKRQEGEPPQGEEREKGE